MAALSAIRQPIRRSRTGNSLPGPRAWRTSRAGRRPNRRRPRACPSPNSYIAGGDVSGERRRRPLLRIAVAAAARRAERDGVALQDHILLLGIGQLAVDVKLAGRAILAAFDAEGREDGTLGEERHGDR